MGLWLVIWAWLAFAGDIQVDVLDVGQGDAILIRTPAQKTILIDAGDTTSPTVPKLKALGVTGFDLVIATHAHADHIGRMAEVLQTFPVKLYVDNGLPHTTQTYNNVMAEVDARGIPYRPARHGMVFNLDDGAKLEVLFPADVPLKDTRSDLNANSVVTRLTHGEDCILFTGDSEDPTEHALMNRGIGPCDVLKVAHHGSNHSTSDAWLSVVKPEVALISLGAGNRYGHPGAETLARLQRAGVRIHRTDLEGTLTAVSSGQGITVRGEHPPTTDVMIAGVKNMPSSSGGVQPTATTAVSSSLFEEKKTRSRKKKDTGWVPATPAEAPTRTYTAAELTGVMDGGASAPPPFLSPYERRLARKEAKKAQKKEPEPSAEDVE